MDWIRFYKAEMYQAKKDGNENFAKVCKEQYRIHVMKSLERPWKLYIEKLKKYPPFYLN